MFHIPQLKSLDVSGNIEQDIKDFYVSLAKRYGVQNPQIEVEFNRNTFSATIRIIDKDTAELFHVLSLFENFKEDNDESNS